MKRRHLNKQPGIGDFKSKCSVLIGKYDPKIIRIIYETIYENVYWKGLPPYSIKNDAMREVKILLKKQRVSIFHLDAIVVEVMEYFGKFLVLLDSVNRRQN